MRNLRAGWRSFSATFLAVLGLVVAITVPVQAAGQRHASLRPAARHPAAIPVRCKTRNKASGTLKYSDWQFPDTLNPYQTQEAVSLATISNIEDEMVNYDNKGHIFPVLFAKLPTLQNGLIRDGGKTVVGVLKQGLRWSDGSEITAADVKFGWQIGMDKASGPYCGGTCDVISKIDVQGKYQVVFHLAAVYAPFLSSGLPPIWPVQWKGAWNKNDVKTAANKLFQDSKFNFESASFPTNGAFQVTQFVKDDRIVLRPMKYYSTMNCGAYVDTLIFAFYSSKPGMIAAASVHDTDATTNYTFADLNALHLNNAAYTIQDSPAYDFENVIFNVDKTYNGSPNPLYKTAVRQALALSLDKVGLIENALALSRRDVQNTIAWTPLILTKKLTQPYADTSIKGQWDPITHSYTATPGQGRALDDAKQLLTKAGYPHGFSLDGYTTSGDPIRASQFAVIQASWNKIGVSFQPNFVPADTLFADWQHSGILQHGKFQVAMYGDTGGPDPDGFKFEFQSQYIDRAQKQHDSTNQNESGIKDKQIDTAFNKAAATFDPRVRQSWYNVWQKAVSQKAYWIPLYYRTAITTVDSSIQNFKPNPLATDEWNTFEWKVRARR